MVLSKASVVPSAAGYRWRVRMACRKTFGLPGRNNRFRILRLAQSALVSGHLRCPLRQQATEATEPLIYRAGRPSVMFCAGSGDPRTARQQATEATDALLDAVFPHPSGCGALETFGHFICGVADPRTARGYPLDVRPAGYISRPIKSPRPPIPFSFRLSTFIFSTKSCIHPPTQLARIIHQSLGFSREPSLAIIRI
jgi:hypothetical protein